MVPTQKTYIFGRDVSKFRFTCLPRFDMNPVVDSSFILASMRGYLKVYEC